VFDLQRGDQLAAWDPGEEVLRRPHGIAWTPRGEAIVTDTARSAVCVLSAADGRPLRQFGSRGDQLQQLRLPFYCAFDVDRDEILVSDNMNYCVKIFDGRTAGRTGAGGGYLRRIGSGISRPSFDSDNYYNDFIMRPSSLGGAAYCVALCLSVCPSVPLSLPLVTSFQPR